MANFAAQYIVLEIIAKIDIIVDVILRPNSPLV